MAATPISLNLGALGLIRILQASGRPQLFQRRGRRKQHDGLRIQRAPVSSGTTERPADTRCRPAVGDENCLRHVFSSLKTETDQPQTGPARNDSKTVLDYIRARLDI